MKMGLFTEKAAASLLAALGILSLVLAGVGFYSLMAYQVSERTQEIGIRMALGARPSDVLGMVFLRGFGITAAGLAAGAVLIIVCGRAASSTLNIPVNAAEPTVFAVTAIFLALVAMVATYVPARRSMKIEPARAIRIE